MTGVNPRAAIKFINVIRTHMLAADAGSVVFAPSRASSRAVHAFAKAANVEKNPDVGENPHVEFSDVGWRPPETAALASCNCASLS